MYKKQGCAPLYEGLTQFFEDDPISFHVPGHKNGRVFGNVGREFYKKVLSIDATELTGLDDLHAPSGIIREAQLLASKWFNSQNTYFLVGGSTVGNLTMILSTCMPGDKVIVQRNCHKSIMNGLELSGARPIFVAPKYDEDVDRFTSPSLESLKKAIRMNPESKALLLTYPDYFGRAYDIETIINYAHQFNIPVLVDEAHGVHFTLGHNFPKPSLQLGADLVVQSAHKMAPAMTMASFLHINSAMVSKERVEHFLQVLQSSSPSYPLMASLDLARLYLENMTTEQLVLMNQSVVNLRKLLSEADYWEVLEPIEGLDDPLKVTVHVREGIQVSEIVRLLEKEHIYPEMASDNQILFLHGLEPFTEWDRLKRALKKVKEQLKFTHRHATIEESKKDYFNNSIQMLTYSYSEMRDKLTKVIALEQIDQHVAAEAIVPYPPGIPIIMKGEVITDMHIKQIRYLLQQGVRFQNEGLQQGIKVFV